MTAAELYDFESNLADTIGAAFSAYEMNWASLTTPPQSHKPRPRAEIIFRPGAALTPARITTVNGLRRIAAYNGDLEITCVTDISATGKLEHSAYRAEVRQILELDTVRVACNGTNTPYTIDWVQPTGTSETFKTDKGYEFSQLSYSVAFSIKASAFVQLDASGTQ
jgi:hypothetical protein